ncbi:hypothetical protein [Streptomyces sp. NPDC023838]|uniref:hypothetical protein n=1 Tax=Streptomyces sp. NPDC023838 TaxID=3154325 RepID=UPI0033F44FB4
MGRTRGAALAVAVAFAVAAAGCDDANGGGPGRPSTSAAPSLTQALKTYQATADPRCTTADECRQVAVRKLAAAAALRGAMEAKDPAGFAEPIRLVKLAQERADTYGRAAGLGVRSNFLTIDEPLQQMETWLRTRSLLS